MNIHASNLRGPANSSPAEGAPRLASLRAAGRGEVAGGRGEGAAWNLRVSVGAEQLGV